MLLHVTSRDEAARTTVRTEVTVQERESAVMFTGSSWSGPKNCPLCGNPMFPVPDAATDEKAQALRLGHREGQGTCPGPGDEGKGDGPTSDGQTGDRQEGKGQEGKGQRRLR